MSKKQVRARISLSARLERRLVAYAAVASAAGLGMLAFSTCAEAEVIFTKIHKVILPWEYYHIDLNHDGKEDFTIKNERHLDSDHGSIYLVAKEHKGNAIAGVVPFSNSVWALALTKGYLVGPNGRFQALHAEMVRLQTGTTNYSSGYWVSHLGVKKRYLGMKFKIDGQVHFGWARLTVLVDKTGFHTPVTATLTGYAYETIPDKPIIAGDKGTGASLGHLALGAASRKH